MARLFLISTVVCMLQSQALAGKMIRFASPLQSLTIPDRDVKEELKTERERFLPRFRAGLKAEVDARRDIASKRTSDLQAAAVSGSNWAANTVDSERARRSFEEDMVEQAFDTATAEFNKKGKGKKSRKPDSSYQFVGVVNRKTSGKPITWYARPKPSHSKWSVRLVHVNKGAIIKDLFNRGEVDIFAKYENTGKVDEETNAPVVTGKYEVRKRSWKNLYNFSPKHFFTDPSGMYWRERRLQQGLYTDGVSVYESSYRYGDGRNGMHRVSGLQQFLGSKAIEKDVKQKIVQRLKTDSPDIVLEL